MPKSLEVTPSIDQQLKAATGDDNLDTKNLVVFETILADSRPLNKRGSVFDKGRLSAGLLGEMAKSLDGKTNPILVMHDADLPQGRVFHAETTHGADGEVELRGLFYLPKDRAALISDIENSVIDSVSVGVRSKQMICSECDFDYMAPEAGYALWDRTCVNGHVVGVDGVHVRMVGLDTWHETSLVHAGAVPFAKIASRAKALMASADPERLAASNGMFEATVLTASFKDANRGTDMDVTALVSSLEGKTVELAQLKVTSEGQAKSIATLTAERDALVTEVAGLKAASEQAAQLSPVTEFLKDHARAALVALGENDPKVPETIADLMTTIKDASVKLHTLIPAGGKATPAADDAPKNPNEAARLSAFRTTK